MTIAHYSYDSFAVCPTVCDFEQVKLLANSLRAAGLPADGRRPIAIAPITNKIHLLSANAPRLDPGDASLPVNPEARSFIVGLGMIRQSSGQPNPEAVRMVQLLSKQGWRPVISGGRYAQPRKSIEAWLRGNSVPCIKVLTRMPEEFRTELVIARSHLHLLRADRLTPAFAIDSSSLAVASWRSNNLATFQFVAGR